MNKNRISLMTFAMVCLTLLTLAFPAPVYAISVLSVSPNQVVNNVVTTVTITGTEFAAGATVTVGGTSVSATFMDPATLTAVIPAGFPAGTHTVQVTNPDTSTASLNAGLIVLTPTPTPTNTAEPTATSAGVFGRPQIIVKSFKTNVEVVQYGQNFKLHVRLRNDGQFDASNLQLAFTSPDLMPVGNAGVVVLGTLQASTAMDADQVMTAIAPIYGKYFTTVDMSILYYDADGTSYTEKFTINIPVAGYGAGSAATATPTGLVRSQLVITNYGTDLEALQPGAQFELRMSVQNMGNAAAKGVTMIVGGGSASVSAGETPQPGGVSGGSGEFTNFAPVGSSNIQSIGDIGPAQGLDVAQKLIVNVSTNPGAYPMKITFSYRDDKGNTVNDEQVITLLVYDLPKVDVGFYILPVTLFAGQPGVLPLQVTNLGKRTTVLGNMTVNADGVMLENNKMLVGQLESGGYFTMDTMVTPENPGSLDLKITIEYTDDFNQLRSIEQSITVDVQAAMEEVPMDPAMPTDMEMPPAEETFLQKAWRFILGLLGLDSGQSGGEPVQEFPVEEIAPLPAPGG